MSEAYKVVRLVNGAYSVRSLTHGETFHPVVGPEAEAEALYVRQLGLADRVRAERGEFVVWDVGLGAAANPVTFLKALEGIRASVRIVSFDCTPDPLRFALQHTNELQYLRGFEAPLGELLDRGNVQFAIPSGAEVAWEFHIGDFPSLLRGTEIRHRPKPHAIFYDAFSPATNSAMWTLPVFRNLLQLLPASRACAMPTYSRSTMMRVTLLLAGFYVGVGHATGDKEETTIAANVLELLDEPLGREWLQRVKHSTSAEPMVEPVYRQAPLSPGNWAKLIAHPQFEITP